MQSALCPFDARYSRRMYKRRAIVLKNSEFHINLVFTHFFQKDCAALMHSTTAIIISLKVYVGFTVTKVSCWRNDPLLPKEVHGNDLSFEHWEYVHSGDW